MIPRSRILTGAVALLVVVGALTALWARRPLLTPVERGRRLAEANGCFSCHGPGGIRGVPNAGRTDGDVPSFPGSLMMFASNSEDVRAWIRDGITPERAESKAYLAERDRGVLEMPAFGDRLSIREIDDLVAFVLATAGEPVPSDSLAAAGLERAESLGCFGCHGAGGRFARPNPGSFKGYVPPWDGGDFPELVRDRVEFDEWVERGMSRRLRENPLARFFLERAAVRMPAYEKHLAPSDLDVLWAYVQWIRERAEF